MMAGSAAGASDSGEITAVDTIEFLQKKRKGSHDQSGIEFTLERAIQNLKSKIRYSTLSNEFPEQHKNSRVKLKATHNKFVNCLIEKVNEGIRELLDEYHVVRLIAELDEMATKRPKTENNYTPVEAWRPTGNPERDIAPHLNAVKLELRERMKQQLIEMKKKRDDIANVNIESCAKLVKLQQRLDDQLAKFKAAAAACQQISRNDVEHFTNFMKTNGEIQDGPAPLQKQ